MLFIGVFGQLNYLLGLIFFISTFSVDDLLVLALLVPSLSLNLSALAE
jgi:hypothetical protein